jgi:hypothetical protein
MDRPELHGVFRLELTEFAGQGASVKRFAEVFRIGSGPGEDAPLSGQIAQRLGRKGSAAESEDGDAAAGRHDQNCQSPAGRLIQIEIADGGRGVGIFFGAFEEFVELFLQHFAVDLLRFEVLLKQRVMPRAFTLQFSDLRGQIFDGGRLHRNRVRNYRSGLGIDFQRRLATRALDLKHSFRHATIVIQSETAGQNRRLRLTPSGGCACLSFDGDGRPVKRGAIREQVVIAASLLCRADA